jgi:hypothetical protein
MVMEPDPTETTASPDSLEQLVAVLHDLAADVPALAVGVLGSASDEGDILDREKGVAVTYIPAGGVAGVQLWLSERRAKLVTRSNDRADLWTEITDRFVLSLGDRPTLADHTYPSHDALARALLRLMRRRVMDAALTARDLESAARPEAGVTAPAPARKRPSRPTAALPAPV